MISRSVLSSLVLLVPAAANAADWSYQWSAAPGSPAPQVDISPFKYGKTWAYTVEIDDGPTSTLTVAQPLLAQRQFTDAPPGVAGGTSMPFVGGAAIIVGAVDTPNNTRLTWSDLRTLQSKGWGVLNHSYSHIGQHWEPVVNLTPQQIRRELFWSQALAITELGGATGRAPSHFVYPNGYTGYQPGLAEYRLQTGSRVGASDPAKGMAYAANSNMGDLNRNNLDGSSWSSAMMDFPTGSGPAAGQVVIDFTHGIDASAQSANQQLWAQRLNTIANTYGKTGADNVWSAPTGDIYEYVAARKAATVTAQSNQLTLSIPSSAPGAALTLHFTGLTADTVLPASPGATIYRSGTEAWVTTPTIETRPSLMEELGVERIYSGPLKDFTWSTPIKIAAVRIEQFGGVPAGFKMVLNATTPDGQVQNLVPAGGETLPDAWGTWQLYDLLPNQDGLLARSLSVSKTGSLPQMEVWAVVPEPASLSLLSLGAVALLGRRFGRRHPIVPTLSSDAGPVS